LIRPVRNFPAIAGDRFFLRAVAGFSAALAFLSARLAGGGELSEENEIVRVSLPNETGARSGVRQPQHISRFVV
jgi:hypothetical protein